MEISVLTVLLLLVIGLAAGIAAGFIGIGGGIIMVPVLIELFRVWDIPVESLQQAARGTSLTVAIFAVSSSVFRHHKQGNVLWQVVPFAVPASMIGGYLSGVITTYIPGRPLQISLAVILLLAAIKMIVEPPLPDRPHRKLSWITWSLIGFGTGLFAGFTGLGGGVFLIPLLAWIAHVPTKKLAATSSGVVVFTSFAASLSYIITQPVVELPPVFLGHVHLIAAGCIAIASIPGAQLGAYWNKKAGSKLYKRIFAVLLIIMVIRLFVTA